MYYDDYEYYDNPRGEMLWKVSDLQHYAYRKGYTWEDWQRLLVQFGATDHQGYPSNMAVDKIILANLEDYLLYGVKPERGKKVPIPSKKAKLRGIPRKKKAKAKAKPKAAPKKKKAPAKTKAKPKAKAAVFQIKTKKDAEAFLMGIPARGHVTAKVFDGDTTFRIDRPASASDTWRYTITSPGGQAIEVVDLAGLTTMIFKGKKVWNTILEENPSIAP